MDFSRIRLAVTHTHISAKICDLYAHGKRGTWVGYQRNNVLFPPTGSSERRKQVSISLL